jgi:ubiquitin thioesterase protein OTUB1
VYLTELSLGALMAKQEEYADAVAQRSAMVSDPEAVKKLRKEYSDRDKTVLGRLEHLSSRYEAVRKTRPDGNSFYRAFAYAYLETVLDDLEELLNAQDIIKRAREDLVCLGYQLFTFEIFYDVFYHVLKSIRHGITRDDLFAFFNHPLVSDSIVAFLRLITAAHLKLDSEYYTSFYKWSKTELERFCAQEVEPMHVEAGDVQMTALSARFGVATRVEYIEPHEVTELTWGSPVHRVRVSKDYLEGWEPRMYMLHRPGQFMVLYPTGRGPGSKGRGVVQHTPAMTIAPVPTSFPAVVSPRMLSPDLSLSKSRTPSTVGNSKGRQPAHDFSADAAGAESASLRSARTPSIINDLLKDSTRIVSPTEKTPGGESSGRRKQSTSDQMDYLD